MARVPTALSIAGSDSSGGAGVQADLKAFARVGVHGMTAITAITAQNTVGVEIVEAVSPKTIVAQVRLVAEDIGVDAVKIGMLGRVETVAAVIEALAFTGEAPVVIDPVMIAESGAVLLEDDARRMCVEKLLPLATVVTPNIPEARALTRLEEDASQEDLARALVELGPRAAVVTGGHSDEIVDYFFDGGEVAPIKGPRYPDGASHGSGCTHSAAFAALLALGHELLPAAERAREITSEAVKNGLREIGHGPGPVDVMGLAPAD
jgi:hydroxymethylpyrimidine/phosphomethylpyrimidine kinase